MNEQVVNEITDRLCEEITYNTSSGSFARDICRSIAIELALENADYENQLNTRLVDTATGVDLEICGNDKGKNIIEATYAVGTVKITGINGTIIKKGTLLINNTNDVIYETIEEKSITNVSTTVMVISKTPGKIGNCSAGQINAFKEIYPGLTAVTNDTEISGAIDRETDDEYRKRLIDYIRKPRISWNKYVFEEEAKVIKEVDRAKCLPLGSGNVKLIITEKNTPIATDEVKQKVHNYINNKILSDINLAVESVSIFDINLSIEAEINQDYNIENAKDEIKEALNSYFFINLFETRLLYFDIANTILNCRSIDKLSDLKINNIKDDLILTEDKLATIKTIMIGGIE